MKTSNIIRLFVFSWLSTVVIFSSGHLEASTVVAKKSGVSVTSKPKGGKVLMKLEKGEALQSISRKGLHWKVELESGQIGYVSVLKVKRRAGTSLGFSKAIRAVAKDGRKNADDESNIRSRSAVMGVRGLDESGETSNAGNVKPNLRMVYAMEDRLVSSKKLNRIENLVMRELSYLHRKKGKN